MSKSDDEGLFAEDPKEEVGKGKGHSHKQLIRSASKAMTTLNTNDNRHISLLKTSIKTKFRKFRSSDPFEERISRTRDSFAFSYDQKNRYSHHLITLMKESRRLQIKIDDLKMRNRLITR